MSIVKRLVAPIVFAICISATMQAQFHKIKGLEVGASATGRYISPIANETSVTPRMTEGVGLLVNMRFAPKSWLGLELNYGMNHANERYTYTERQGLNTNTINAPVNVFQHEATLGYVLHVKRMWGVQPFVVVGGGAVDFVPRDRGPNQWRGAGMYEVGFDIIPKWTPNVGFRIQQHGLLYKAPDFYADVLRSNTWVHQSAPAAGVFFRF